MIANAFTGHPAPPTNHELASTLGPAKPLWDQLLLDLAKSFALTTHEWNSYSRKAGWALRLKRGDRNILYLSPGMNCFMASFALGDRAVLAAQAANLPKPILQLISEAKRHAEGAAVRLDIHNPKDLSPIKTLVKLKLEN